MHAEAFEFCQGMALVTRRRGLDLGGRDINGSVRHFWPDVEWYVVDIEPGPGVNIVANAADYRTEIKYDIVLCTEVFEHTPEWRGIIKTAADALRQRGNFVTTCAGEGRGPHSAVGADLPEGEWYANLSREELADEMRKHFSTSQVFFNAAAHGGDLYAWGQK